ncbi:cytochrome P450 [Scytonema sp. HK-05]|uniref:cytochrome P450 n=1 Tax=Scytonema sp. HK-05 TaxID=1137095 RepID=UPI0009366649|nr:cytochrome P450 [Scytonema sp. HK-05]OKH60758.1 cytochrome P450 [Scytonema sp. HK-05]BAY45052.1 cytochrome P450 [Scytonema sp. HK-05]
MNLSSHSLPPGSFGLPLIGETLSFLKERDFLKNRQNKYGSIFKTKIFGQPTVVMIGSQANRFIMSSHKDCFSHDGWPDTFKSLLGNKVLLLQEGDEHRRKRKLLMPTLHGSALSNYLPKIEEISRNYLQQWEKLDSLVWFPQLGRMTFEIASKLLIGSESGEVNDYLFKLFIELNRGLLTIPIRWHWTPYSRALQAREQILAYIDKAIQHRQQQPTQDVLGLLIQAQDEDGQGLTKEEIKSQALALLIGTNANTASMLTSLCMALGQHPHVLAKARAEQQIFQTDKLSLEKLKLMVYLDLVLKEVERCYPPVGAGFRRVIKPFVFNDYYVPATWNAIYSITGTHNDPQIYTSPELFDPERFNQEQTESKKIDFSLVGFGGGTRNCLGIAFAQTIIKVFTVNLLRSYTWELLRNQDLTLNRVPVLHPRSGLKIRLSRI